MGFYDILAIIYLPIWICYMTLAWSFLDFIYVPILNTRKVVLLFLWSIYREILFDP